MHFDISNAFLIKKVVAETSECKDTEFL